MPALPNVFEQTRTRPAEDGLARAGRHSPSTRPFRRGIEFAFVSRLHLAPSEATRDGSRTWKPVGKDAERSAPYPVERPPPRCLEGSAQSVVRPALPARRARAPECLEHAPFVARARSRLPLLFVPGPQ